MLTQNKFLTDNEIKELKRNLSWTKNRVHVMMIEFALYTGARQSEILEVVARDLNDDGTVIIHGKKGSNNRSVPLPANFYSRLKAFVKGLEANDKIFPVATRTFRHVWKQVTPNKLKSLHCLRHTMGVKLYNNCESIHTVKYFLGHKSITNSMVYLDFVESSRKAKKSINGMWSRKLDVAA